MKKESSVAQQLQIHIDDIKLNPIDRKILIKIIQQVKELEEANKILLKRIKHLEEDLEKLILK